jgi:NAD(P)-dependent dehydrogenase (short-subunit alcohol dehydrogenase family)
MNVSGGRYAVRFPELIQAGLVKRAGRHLLCRLYSEWRPLVRVFIAVTAFERTQKLPQSDRGEEQMAMQDGGTKFGRYPSLEGRVVLVTGGATGIGESIVTHFSRQGSRVAFFDIQDEAARRLVEELTAEGCPAPLYLHCDLTDIAALRSAVEQVLDHWGGVDVLVNNAANDQRHTIEEVTPEYWEHCMQLNLKHHFFCIQAVLPAMRRAGRGSIINMSSISWIIPSTGVPLYIAAKAAIVGLTRTLAHELGGDNIRVNAVLPGAIATERQKQLWYTPAYKAEIMASQALKRDILPEDVARLALFLGADDSSAITNQSYVVDGGWV